MLPETNFKPTVFIFDQDETLFTVYRKKEGDIIRKYIAQLTLSAEKSLREDPFDHAFVYDRVKKDGRTYKYYMHAIEREKFKHLFNRLYEVIQSYTKNCPIAVKVMTRGEYSKFEIQKAWDKFYGNKDQRFTIGAFPFEMFNCNNFKKDGKLLGNNAKPEEYLKEVLIEEHFPRWQKEMPGLEKSRVYLLDNDDETVLNVRMAGFSAINFPTEYSSEDLDYFAEDGPKAFAAIDKLIDEAIGQHVEDKKQSNDSFLSLFNLPQKINNTNY